MNRPKGEIGMTSVFDEYKGEMHPIIKNAELLNTPFRIQRMKDRTNVSSDYGTKDSMLCTIEIIETGEVFTYFGENAAIYAKMKWLLVEKSKEFPAYELKIVKKVSAKKNEYFDLVDASSDE